MASHFSLARTLSTRCALLVVGLACLMPLAAKANSCPSASTSTCFVNLDGNASTKGSGASTQFTLNNSELIQIGNMTGTGLGHISFSTGMLIGGSSSSLMYGGSFAAGGSFTITGTYGGITNGTLFSGAFSGPTSWVLNSATNCTVCSYTLTGTISGTWFPHGATLANGATVQIDFTSNGLYKGGKNITDVGGVSYINVPAIPEPATVGLMGTGLMCMGLLVRRKTKQDQRQV